VGYVELALYYTTVVFFSLTCPLLSCSFLPSGDPQNPEIVQLKAGMLFLVRPDSIKGSRECM